MILTSIGIVLICLMFSYVVTAAMGIIFDPDNNSSLKSRFKDEVGVFVVLLIAGIMALAIMGVIQTFS